MVAIKTMLRRNKNLEASEEISCGNKTAKTVKAIDAEKA
jgi:hypothetical protein